MEDFSRRLTPEEALKIATEHPQKGKLKIFIGYAPGVGKSFTMLNEGNRRHQRGEDLIIGYVELHGRQETEKQIGDLEVIPRKKIEYGGKTMEEMDTEAIIKRHPTTVLVDELAHTNVPGSKYVKRYEDVDEILRAGINVITTLNVQHLESLNDVIKQITGITVRETIPDGIVENADEIVAVDITVEALLNRLKRGDIYKKDKITDALSNFFREGNLNALREISLRQTAQEVDEELELYMKAHGIRESWQTTERILVCISPSPNAKKLIRRGALIARRYRCEWYVVAVESAVVFSQKWSQKDKEDLENNFALAKQLGAATTILSGRSISDELAKFAKEKNITQIVIGHSEKSPFQALFTGSTASQLLSETKNIAIHVIPTGGEIGTGENWFKSIFGSEMPISDFWKTVVMGLIVSIINYLLAPYLGYEAIGFIFLFAVLVLSMFVSFIYIVLFAVISALTWNFFFIPPTGTFVIANPTDLIMSVVYIITAIVTGYLTSKIRRDERLLAVREARTDTMHRITTIIAGARDRLACIEEIEREIGVILPGKCKVIVKSDKTRFDETLRQTITGDEKELSVAMWAFEKGETAGWSTDTLTFAGAMYLPLKGPSENIGVLLYRPEHYRTLSQDEKNFLGAATNQLAIYLEREILKERALEADELKKSEGLYRTILDSVSHEIKTPVTSIVGIASALQDANIICDQKKLAELARDLSDSAERLNRIVTNLLDMSRLASGMLSIKKDWQEVRELVNVCVQRLSGKLIGHRVRTEIADGLPLIKIDFALLEQALQNVLWNSINYTPEESEIAIRAFREQNRVVVIIEDNGPGVKEAELPYIFDKFYRTKEAPPGGTGLGLAITKAIVEAHDGEIAARNRKEGGLEVRFSLPIEAQPVLKDLPNE
ncbi:MAG: sensor histidine kinase KdpD [Candidatus Margulisbacteria bacterium]|nr:sensor histidine kinase KdpD [Candidatus Margulisiibacteriota bacterium]